MANEAPRDYYEWHRPYDTPGSRLSRRLDVVRQRLREALDEREGPVSIISMCAGQGRDVIPVLATHPRASAITALLVELDPRNAEAARAAALEAALEDVTVIEGDAALTDNYEAAAPADVVLACGIFGNISDDDIHRTIASLPMLCASRATVLWTRGWTPEHDLTPTIRAWFADAGFEELAFDAPPEWRYSVGVNRYVGRPRSLERGLTLFRFVR